MFENRWNEDKEKIFIQNFVKFSVSADHARRAYSSQLIGSEKELVMHGGGNTSCKTTCTDIFGKKINVLCVKGSGWDLGTIEPVGLPAVKLEPLLDLQILNKLSDEAMINIQRANLIDSSSPNPSIETLLHAFLPAKFIDHTHATPFLALANLPNAEKVMEEIFGKTMAYVPYVMPGFELSKKAAEIFQKNPNVEGLLLGQHGHFTWGETAKESYDRVIEQTNKVEDWLSSRRTPLKSKRKKYNKNKLKDFLLTIRGLLKNENNQLPILKLVDNDEALSFLERSDILKNAAAGVATPDHVIRLKAHPLYLSEEEILGGKTSIKEKIDFYTENYQNYFDVFSSNSTETKVILSRLPKIVWAEGIGLIGVGDSAQEAKTITEIGMQNIRVMSDSSDSGGFSPVSAKNLFDMEYWSLEQAKLGKKVTSNFAGKVVLITGGAGKIGSAIAHEFSLLAAQVVILDHNVKALEKSVGISNNNIVAFKVDLKNGQEVRKVIEKIILRFGGLDILISNAGIAPQGSMVQISEKLLRESFEINFFTHFSLSREFYQVFRKQGSEGQILFNISKQAINPGKNFGAYGLPKATLMALVRQLALEFGEFGIRVNGVNADRIQSGLLSENMIKERAKARGVSIKDYLSGNLLRKEVQASHVAKAFVALAKSTRTTGHVMTVDGGNVEATLR